MERETGEWPFSSPSAVESCDLLKGIRGNLNQPNCYQVDNIFSAFIPLVSSSDTNSPHDFIVSCHNWVLMIPNRTFLVRFVGRSGEFNRSLHRVCILARLS